jgi:hypothetical protein
MGPCCFTVQLPLPALPRVPTERDLYLPASLSVIVLNINYFSSIVNCIQNFFIRLKFL